MNALEWREIERGFLTAFGSRGRYDIGPMECGCCLWWSLNGSLKEDCISAIGRGDQPAIELAEEYERTGKLSYERMQDALNKASYPQPSTPT